MNAKEAIDQAFLRLLHKLPLNKITVIHICQEANVNRQSFYYYYRDIIHILKEVIFQDIYAEIQKGRSYENWQHGFITLMDYLKTNRLAFMNMYHSTYWPEINDFFAQCATSLLQEVVEECACKAHIHISPPKKTFIIDFYRIVFIGILTEWILKGAFSPPSEVLADLQKLICGTIPNALERFRTEDSF